MKEIDSQVGWGPFSQDDDGIRQREIYICTFAMLAKLVSSDGDISKKELMLIDHLMRETLKLNEERRNFVTSVFNAARRSPTTFEELARRYKIALRSRPQMYEWLIDVLFRISLADEVLAEEEMEFLHSACRVLDISDEKFEEIRARYAPKQSRTDSIQNDQLENTSSYKVLGLNPGTSFEQVRQRYESVIRGYDIEKLLEGGFADDLVAYAQKKQAELTAAFLEIRRSSKDV